MQSLHKVNLAEYGLSMITFKYKLYKLNDRYYNAKRAAKTEFF